MLKCMQISTEIKLEVEIGNLNPAHCAKLVNPTEAKTGPQAAAAATKPFQTPVNCAKTLQPFDS